MTYKLSGRYWLSPCPRCENPKREIINDGDDGLTILIGCPKCGRISRNVWYEEYVGEVIKEDEEDEEE